MLVSMNQKIPSDMIIVIPLEDVGPQNDLSDPDSEQRTPLNNEGSERNEQNGHTVHEGGGAGLFGERARVPFKVGRFISKHRKKFIAGLFITLVAIIGAVVFYISSHAQTQQPEVMSTPKLPQNTSCPQDWIPYTGTGSCYRFFNIDTTWDLAHNICSSFNASLLVITTCEEMDFIRENKNPTEHWLGYQRMNKTEPWKQDFKPWSDINGTCSCASQNDGAVVSSTVCIKGDGLCATLNAGDVMSSTDCDNSRHFICRKPL